MLKPRRKVVTNRMRSVARQNLQKAHVSRIRLREPRSLNRVRKIRDRGRVYATRWKNKARR